MKIGKTGRENEKRRGGFMLALVNIGIGLCILVLGLFLIRFFFKHGRLKLNEEEFLRKIGVNVGERKKIKKRKNWKMRQIIQPEVSKLLYRKAEAVHLLMNNVKAIEGDNNISSKLQRLSSNELLIQISLMDFWELRDAAERLGFSVKKSYKEYMSAFEREKDAFLDGIRL